MEKRCSKCKHVKPLAEFYARSDRGGLGVMPHCKVCSAEKHRAWYEKNRLNPLPRRPASKECWKCGQNKPASAFGSCRAYADGLNPQCKVCARKYASAIGNPAERLRDPRGRAGHLWFRYRLRKGQYAELLQSQGNACGICRQPFTRTPHVDHCHRTGRVRGLLCSSCNALLAALDKEGFIVAATAYLKQSEGG